MKNRLKYLVHLILLAAALQTLLRLIFLIFNYKTLNIPSFGEFSRSLAAGLVFDLPATAYIYGVFFLYCLLPDSVFRSPRLAKGMRWFSLIPSSLIILLNLIDTGFYQFTLKRSGAELFDIVGTPGNPIMSYLLNYWHLVLILIGLVFLSYRFFPKPENAGKMTLAQWFLTLLLTGSIWILMARGGTRLKPIRPVDAAELAPASLVPLTIGTPFQIICMLESERFPRPAFMSVAEAESIIKPFKRHDGKDPARKWNVVIITLESFSAEFCGWLNPGTPSATPFLDSLSRLAWSFPNCFASGTRSVEAVPGIWSGLPGLTETPIITGPYQTNRFPNIAALLETRGYRSSFYHGGHNGTMGFQSYLARTGLKNYFGMDEYSGAAADNDGHWGIWDKPYLQYWEKELEKMPEPFISGIFTLSSHHPYKLPASDESRIPADLPIIRTIRYTDEALEGFFRKASTKKWFANTLFVITADHTAPGKDRYYSDFPGKYRIPLLVYKPGLTEISKPQALNEVVCQNDILPMVMEQLGDYSRYFALGHDPISDHPPRPGIVLRTGDLFSVVSKNYRIATDLNGEVKMTEKLDLAKRITTKIEFGQCPEGPAMLNYLKAFLVVYGNRINDNSMLPPVN